MKREEKARRIQATLDRLYPAPAVPLDHEDPYTLLVAVLLSAQCTDKKVNETTPKLFALARTPQAMAALSADEIREVIKPCGLSPAKSKALRELSRLLLERHGGEVPRTFEELEDLPGVGHKTASVVMSHAFHQPAFPVDTHIHRLAERWGLSDGRSVEQTERDLKATFPEKDWDRLHLQIIYFGREHCPALRHDLRACPICSFAASKAALAASPPAAKASKAAPAPRSKARGAPAAGSRAGAAPPAAAKAKRRAALADARRAKAGGARAPKASSGGAPGAAAKSEPRGAMAEALRTQVGGTPATAPQAGARGALAAKGSARKDAKSRSAASVAAGSRGARAAGRAGAVATRSPAPGATRATRRR